MRTEQRHRSPASTPSAVPDTDQDRALAAIADTVLALLDVIQP